MFRSRRTSLRPLLAAAALAVALAAPAVPGAGASEWQSQCGEPPPPAGPGAETGTIAEPPPAEPCPPPPEEPLPPPTETAAPEEPEPAATTPAPTREPQEKAPTEPAPAADEAAGAKPAAPFRIARAPLTVTPPLAGGPYVFPVVGPASFTDTWGAARATVAWHHGVDIFAPLGAPLVAVADGTVFMVGWNRIGGWRLWLRDREGNLFYYAHLSAFSPHAVDGKRVRAGTVLGFVGNTGDAVGTPYHLHFEIHPVSLLSLGYDGAVNPTPYVSAWRRLDTASGDFSLAAGLRWGAGPLDAAGDRRAVAPAAGAVLLGYTDIASSGGDLAGAEFAPVELDEAALALAGAPAEPLPAQEQEAQEEPDDVEPFDPAHARVVRLLEEEAELPATFTGGVWDRLAQCEAGGNWSTSTGNGYFGGLQFHPNTWLSHGGGDYAPTADGATRQQQIAVAARVLASQGWNAWPACSRKLGLR
jgi:hypothetical protein